MTIYAWHFLSENRKTQWNGITVIPGQPIFHNGKLEICQSGLHASVNLIDALQYAPGPILCRVRCEGTIIQGQDKLVCSQRTALWMFDASSMLRLWVCWCIRNTKISNGRTVWDLLTDPRSRAAVEMAEKFALGKATKEQLAAAWDAAGDAAWDASWDASWDAAGAAARAATRAAARAATWVAAWDAARDAVRDAVRDAAWAAAWAASWDAAGKRLAEMAIEFAKDKNLWISDN